MLNELKDERILILGFGREGRDNFRFLRRIFPDKILGIGDRLELEKLDGRAKEVVKKDKKLKLHLGENYLKALKNYEVIIKSPGIPPKLLTPFITKKQKITSQTEIFLDYCPGKIVGVTGTKGKSTTTSLIYQILKQGGVKVHLVGNIGKPVLNLLFSATQNDVYVYELSSHQLYNLKKSPQIAVFLNIYPDHLDYYRNFKEYANAKANITLYQTKDDYLIYNARDKIIKEFAKKSRAKKIPITAEVPVEFFDTCRKSQLKGNFNLLNIRAAIEVGRIFKIPKKIIAQGIKNFRPLAHRLELVGTFKGITFYNDALSTIPETAIAALDALGDNVQTIFLGGFDRKIDFKKLAKRILKSKIKNVILFPTTGEKIWKEICRQRKLVALRPFFVNNMREGVKLAYEHTQKGKICLLSCASTSFSIFRDYKEKGNLFKKYVRKFGKLVD